MHFNQIFLLRSTKSIQETISTDWMSASSIIFANCKEHVCFSFTIQSSYTCTRLTQDLVQAFSRNIPQLHTTETNKQSLLAIKKSTATGDRTF